MEGRVVAVVAEGKGWVMESVCALTYVFAHACRRHVCKRSVGGIQKLASARRRRGNYYCRVSVFSVAAVLLFPPVRASACIVAVVARDPNRGRPV